MTDNKTLGHVDWLRYSVPLLWRHDAEKSIEAAMPPYPDIKLTPDVLPNPRGYNQCRKLTIGRVAWHSQRPEQKLGFEFTGEDMQAIDASNIPVRLLLAHARTCGANVTRLDFAIDIFDSGGRVSDLSQAWDRDEIKTPIRKAGDYKSKERNGDEVTSAETFYLGSPKSDRQIRVYDKGIEQGLDIDWLRVELVVRKERAMTLANDMIEHGVIMAGVQAVRDTMQAPVGWYTEALQGRVIELTPVARKEHDTEKWLLTQVLPVLKRELLRTLGKGDMLLFNRYRDALEQARITYLRRDAGI